jgi:hypothetical protein
MPAPTLPLLLLLLLSLTPAAAAAPDDGTALDDRGAVAIDTPATVADAPATVADAPATVADAPATVADAPATVADAPAIVADTPATVDDAPSTAPRTDRRIPATVAATPVVDPRVARPQPSPTAIDPRSAVVVDGGSRPPTPSSSSSSSSPSSKAPDGVSFSGIPAISYIADNGLGLGVIAAAYVGDGATLPYRTAVTLQLFATQKLVQDSHLTVDALRVLDLPLRVGARVGFLASLTQNYCGEGGDVRCDDATAVAAARTAGLVDDEGNDDDDWDRFVRRYYQRRFMNPYGFVNARYALRERTEQQPLRVELTAGYRASWFVPGSVFLDEDGDGAGDLTPWPGSLYATVHPDGEPGLSSLVSLGVMFDSRDQEPSPVSGWWTEASVRATTPGLSTWNYVGFHVTVRGFTPVSLPGLGNSDRRLVLAHRLLFDGIVGDAPVQDLARLGGSQDTYAFGGADIGRGIRVQRFLGALKVLDQVELRWRFAELSALGQAFAFTAVGFVDAGLVGDRLLQPRHLGVAAGGGGALRVAWNENFVVRCDVAASPVEGWAPQTYITVAQPF